ncbi:glycosyltransferase family 4 protein [Microbacterium lacticum]
MASVVIAVNYYTPYVSGLTNVARDVAEGFADRGHDVTVVASQHDASLPLEEVRNGVRIVRCPVRVRLGKGVISPSFIPTVVRLARSADMVNLHAPMLEAGAIAQRLAATGVPFIFTYHCDVSLPPSLLGSVQGFAMDVSTRTAARRAFANVVSSADYAAHSRVADALSKRQKVIAPGCHLRAGGAPTFRETDGLHVGFLGRIVEEKGIEHLVDGFIGLDDPDARLLLAGDFANIAGGSVIDRVRERIGNDDRIRVLGFLPDDALADFYASLDAFALVSVNAFEAFGIVQVEAMMAGVPAVSSDLPGVRTPVQETGFGVVVPRRDPSAITEALASWAERGFDADQGASAARDCYEVGRATDAYEALIRRVVLADPALDQGETAGA